MLTCAVVIPTLNEADTIQSLVRTLRNDKYPDIQIIVVDGGSTDNTVRLAEKEGATVIQEDGDTKSLPGARNQGARYAIDTFDADVLCFLDGDLQLSEDFVATGMHWFNKDENVVAVRTVADAVRNSLLMKVYSPIEDMSEIANKSDDAPPPPAHFYRRKAFEGVGGFEILGFREDWAFYNKVRRYATENDSRIVFETDCIRYGKLDSFKEFIHQQEWYGRTFIPYLQYAHLRRGIADLFLFRPLVFIASLGALLVYPLVRRRSLLALGVPFILKFGQLLYESVKHRSPYIVPNLFLRAIGNCAFLYGVLKHIIGDDRLTRGIE